jgi:hypothetical protein
MTAAFLKRNISRIPACALFGAVSFQNGTSNFTRVSEKPESFSALFPNFGEFTAPRPRQIRLDATGGANGRGICAAPGAKSLWRGESVKNAAHGVARGGNATRAAATGRDFS